MSGQAVPEYQRAAGEIKAMITSGRIRDGIKVPEIEKLTGTTNSTARRVAKELENEGVLQAHHGKGYAVVAMPDQAATERADANELRRQIATLRGEVQTLSAQLERVDADVEDLFDKLGYDRADGSSEPPAARRGRTG